MDMQKILTEAAAKVGPSGQEMQVAEYFAEQFRPLVDEVTVDNLFNVIAHKKGTGLIFAGLVLEVVTRWHKRKK